MKMTRVLAIGLTLATLIGLFLFFQGATPDPAPKPGDSASEPSKHNNAALTRRSIELADGTKALHNTTPGAEPEKPQKTGVKSQKKDTAKAHKKKRRWQRQRMRFLVNRWVPGMEEFSSDKNQSLIDAKLEMLLVNLNLDQRLLENVLSDLNENGLGFEIRVDPRVLEYLRKNELEISLRLKNLSLKNALTLILSVHPDLVYFIENGILEVTWKQFAPINTATKSSKPFASVPVDRLHGTYRDVLEKKRVTFKFNKTTMLDVVSFLQDISGLNITISQLIDPEEMLVTLDGENLSLETALNAILSPHKLHWIFENETLKIVDKASSDKFWAEIKEIESQQKSAQDHLNSSARVSLNSANLSQGVSFLRSQFQVGVSFPSDYRWDGALRVRAGDSLALICERMALLGDGSWELRQQSSGQYTVHFWQTQPGLLDYCQGLIDEANMRVSANIQDNYRNAFEKLVDTATESKTQALQFKENSLILQSATQLRIRRKAYLKKIKTVARHSLKAWLASNADKSYEGLAKEEDILKAYELRHRLGLGDELPDLLNNYILWINQTSFEEAHPGLKLLKIEDD